MSTATAIKPKNRVESFNELLDGLEHKDRVILHKLLGHNGSNRLTRLINPMADNLGEFTAKEVAILSELLSIPAHELIMHWGLGRNMITLDEANELVQGAGYAWGLVNHIV